MTRKAGHRGVLWLMPRPLTEDHLDWQSRAACKGHPTEWWYPTLKGGGDLYPEETAKALALCHECPVYRECLDECLLDPPDAFAWGIRAGLDQGERKQIRTKARRNHEPLRDALHREAAIRRTT